MVAMVFLGVAMVLLGGCHGVAMVLLGHYFGVASCC